MEWSVGKGTVFNKMSSTSSSCPYRTHKRLAIRGMVQLFTFDAVLLCCEGQGGDIGSVELSQRGEMSVFDMHST